MLRGHYAAAVALSAFCLADGALAQQADAKRIESMVADVVRDTEGTFECDVMLIGEPVIDQTDDAWLIAYSASGRQCDEATEHLQARGDESGLFFYRRPNTEQLMTMLARERRAVESGYVCQITFRRKPYRPQGSDKWYAELLATGTDCNAALTELRQRVRDLDVFILNKTTNRGLINDVR